MKSCFAVDFSQSILVWWEKLKLFVKHLWTPQKFSSLVDTCQWYSTSPANHEPRSLANGVFKIQGFVCKHFPSSPPPHPPLSFSWLLPHFFFFCMQNIEKSCSLASLGFSTPQKCLLRRLSNWSHNKLKHLNTRLKVAHKGLQHFSAFPLWSINATSQF